MTAQIIKFPARRPDKYTFNVEPVDIRYDTGEFHGSFYYTEERKRFKFTKFLNPLNWNVN